MRKIFSLYGIIVGNFVLILLISSIVTLLLMWRNLSESIDTLSKDRLQEMLIHTNEELSSFFKPIERILHITKDHASKGMFNPWNIEKYNQYFVPIIKHSSQISSAMLANKAGDEYLILQKDSLWIVRLTDAGSEKIMPEIQHWIEDETGKLKLIHSYSDTIKYDPRVRPWFELGKSNPVDTIKWTDPYTFFTTHRPGITAVVNWDNHRTGEKVILALDVLLKDISEFTTKLKISENGKIFIINRDNRIIGLPAQPRFQSEDSIYKYVLRKPIELNDPIVTETIQQIRGQEALPQYFPFRWETKIWWFGSSTYRLGSMRALTIAAIVPESDFFFEIRKTRIILLSGFGLIIIFSVFMATSYFQKRRDNRIIESEKVKNEKLLLKTFPERVVNDLMLKGKSDPQKFTDVSVMFTDIAGFTEMASQLDPNLIIEELNDIYTAYDNIIAQNKCERIKTIGDAYLAVCGMPEYNPKHAEHMLKASIEILQYMENRSKTADLKWKIRIGLHSGTVVGGIVGIKKYIYDIFGDTINTASRMESNSEIMKINISESTHQYLIKSSAVDRLNIQFIKRPGISVKGKGEMDMYFVMPKS